MSTGLTKMALAATVCVLAVTTCAAQTLNSAGATFPYPVYSQWFHDFRERHPDVNVNYQAVGSGMGITQLVAGAIDFGASDMPMTDEQMSVTKSRILHFPTVMGGVVPIYNVGGISQEIRFTPEILAGIFLGRLKKWNDGEIQAANPGLQLPGERIVAVHRSDASGTTFVFTDYLSKTVPSWRSAVGSGASVTWPGAEGEKGSDGVSGRVKRSSGSIGYVELAYALRNKLYYGSVRNLSGVFVRADMKTVTAAAASISSHMPEDFRVSITNAPGMESYPISTFTWLLVPQTAADPMKRKAIKSLLRWILTAGQTECATLGYAPLPAEVTRAELLQIPQIR